MKTSVNKCKTNKTNDNLDKNCKKNILKLPFIPTVLWKITTKLQIQIHVDIIIIKS